MNLVEKIRFVADRMEDEKPFYSQFTNELIHFRYSRHEESFERSSSIGSFFQSSFTYSDIAERSTELKLAPIFTDVEKTILENIYSLYEWIARDKDGGLYAYVDEPRKTTEGWAGRFASLDAFPHMFSSIKRSDEKPVNFREYLRGRDS